MEGDPCGGTPIQPYPPLTARRLKAMRELHRAVGRLCLPLLVVAVTGCAAVESQAKHAASAAVDKGVSVAAEAIVGAAFTDALSRLGITLDGEPSCSSKLDTDVKGLTVKGTVNCSATTDSGKAAAATFKGVIAVGSRATSCKGHFLVTVDGKAKVDKDVDVCELAKSS
jgi:hypothetical protein